MTSTAFNNKQNNILVLLSTVGGILGYHGNTGPQRVLQLSVCMLKLKINLDGLFLMFSSSQSQKSDWKFKDWYKGVKYVL